MANKKKIYCNTCGARIDEDEYDPCAEDGSQICVMCGNVITAIKVSCVRCGSSTAHDCDKQRRSCEDIRQGRLIPESPETDIGV